LEAADGEQIKGNIRFTDTGSGVRIVASLTDASPGEHGIHIHEKGDCSDIPGKSMGGHFAPGGNEHALPDEASQRHLGDLGNIVVGGEGEGRLEITIADANLEPGDPMSFAGKALVIHQGRDSGKAKQPSGDSGTPIACGVITESDE
jgi:Cu-Zn family superoxide dismutase